MLDKISVKENSIAILGYHSGSAGQVEVIVMDISTGDVRKTKLNYE